MPRARPAFALGALGALAAFVAVAAVVSLAAAPPARAEKDPDALREKLGDALAGDWVALAALRAEAAIYGGPDCADRERLSRDERALCRETDDLRGSIDKTMRRIEKARAKGELPEAPPGSRAEDRVFRALRAGLFDMAPRMRWESLRALVEFCADRGVAVGSTAAPGASGVSAPPTGGIASTCVVELEDAALTVLANHDEPFLRHFALELLATGRFLTPDALDPLGALAKGGRTGARGCEPILGRLGAHRELEAVARGYEGGFFACEPQLARTALARMRGE